MSTLQTHSPIDGAIVAELELHSLSEVDVSVQHAGQAQHAWAELSVDARCTAVGKFVDALLQNSEAIGREITLQMGRPLSQTPGELAGFEERARHMISIAPTALAHHQPTAVNNFDRYIERLPLGTVAVLSPWNYPLLTSVNAIVPALLAGNAVLLKHSGQTPLVAERYAAAALASLPQGVFQILHLDHHNTAALVSHPNVDGVCFTGSVTGGLAVQQALSNKFVPCGLELGGKDPAYVRADADLDFTVGNLVDGAFFNSGQSCCGIERIYVHQDRFDSFVEQFVAISQDYVLGNPLDAATTLGPMVKASAADYVRQQVTDAVAAGAQSLISESHFGASAANTPYLGPQVLIDVNHSMSVMCDESFGPVIGIMRVGSDEEALALMNDSDYGLTASLWTEDVDAARQLGRHIDTGTVFLNRCDYLDPALAWTGVKNTGRGVSLSALGFDQVTRLKSWHLRTHR